MISAQRFDEIANSIISSRPAASAPLLSLGEHDAFSVEVQRRLAVARRRYENFHIVAGHAITSKDSHFSRMEEIAKEVELLLSFIE